MDFITFARAHGVVISRFLEDGKWHRCGTVDKPKSSNGAYMSRGAYGFVQDHGTMLEPAMWRPEGAELAKIDHDAIARVAREAARQIRQDREKAARKAGWILHHTTVGTHPYLATKGFAEEGCAVWTDDEDGLFKMVIPMRVAGRLVGLQQIHQDPEDPDKFVKRFLFGQRCDEAVHIIDNKGPNFYVEGYATALSVRAALQAAHMRYRIFVCFSAANLVKVAKAHGAGFSIIDYDRPSKQVPEQGGMGWKVAREIGLPYWTSDTEGEDANDYHQRVGLFRWSQALKMAVMRGMR